MLFILVRNSSSSTRGSTIAGGRNTRKDVAKLTTYQQQQHIRFDAFQSSRQLRKTDTTRSRAGVVKETTAEENTAIAHGTAWGCTSQQWVARGVTTIRHVTVQDRRERHTCTVQKLSHWSRGEGRYKRECRSPSPNVVLGQMCQHWIELCRI